MATRRDKAKELMDIVGALYEAAFDNALWPQLARHVSRVFDSPSACIQAIATPAAQPLLLTRTDNIHDAAMESYRQYYWQRDVWVNAANELGRPGVLLGTDMISSSDLENSEFWQDWSRGLEQYHIVGAMFATGGGGSGAVGVHRPRNARGFDEADRHMLGLLLPHMRNALRLQRELADAEAARCAALDGLERARTAIVVVARDGRVVFANRIAEQLLAEGDGVAMVGHRLVARHDATSRHLARLVDEVASLTIGQGEPASHGFLIPRLNRMPLTAMAAPFPVARSLAGCAGRGAILLLKDPETPGAAGDALREIFGLTRAEASLTAALAQGDSLETFAAAGGVTMNTARTHLKRVFEKTGTCRQGQLISLILRSSAYLAARGGHVAPHPNG